MPVTFPAKTLIIDENYIKKNSSLNGAVDANLIYASMYVAQIKNVQPYLGTALYEKILSDIAAGTLAGDYLDLVTKKLADVCCWWTMIELIPKLTYKYDNGSLQQRISEDSTPISDAQMKDEIDRARHNAEFFTRNLIEYLCEKSSLFPEYSQSVSPCKCPLKRVRVATSFMFTFTNENNNCCND
jgi:hypothetical protein